MKINSALNQLAEALAASIYHPDHDKGKWYVCAFGRKKLCKNIATAEAWAKYLSRNYTYDQIGDLYIERAEPHPGFPRTLKNQ